MKLQCESALMMLDGTFYPGNWKYSVPRSFYEPAEDDSVLYMAPAGMADII